MTAEGPAPASSGSSARPKIIGAVGIVVVLAVAAALFVFAGSDDAAAGEIFVEPLGSAGPDPFTDSITAEPVATLADYARRARPPIPMSTLRSCPTARRWSRFRPSRSELWSRQPRVQPCRCSWVPSPGRTAVRATRHPADADQLVGFLAEDDAKAATWAGVHEIAVEDIESFVADLTPLRLTRDTLVLNHRFVDGEAEPRQTVLQKGEAVLVDELGTPRVKCSSGNPLLAPTAPELLADGDVGGEPWRASTPQRWVSSSPPTSPSRSSW